MRRVAVAVSGGRDSTALLHCTLKAALPLGVEVVALHVHHGLMPAADDWLAQVRRQARRWGAGFAATRLDGKPGSGDSIEAWARRERYLALGTMAGDAGCTMVLLAHHRRDQAETWLLQALRGGGPAGLSAMPGWTERRGLIWARPWLQQPRAAVDAYVKRHRLRHVDDDSNADPRHARNRLRLQVWPALEHAFPDVEIAFAGAATRAQEAAALAAEVGAADLYPLLADEALAVEPWRALPAARRRNALRAWLGPQGPVPQSLLDRLMAELPAVRTGRWPAPCGELRLYRGLLRLLRLSPGMRPGGNPVEPSAVPLDLRFPGSHGVPGWAGHISVQTATHNGIESALLQTVLARARAGGERFRVQPNGLPRSLKKQYQARAVPAWQRAGPLLFAPDGRLLFVPGLGIDAALQATPGMPQLTLDWCPAG